jgi:hypothetical protein
MLLDSLPDTGHEGDVFSHEHRILPELHGVRVHKIFCSKSSPLEPRFRSACVWDVSVAAEVIVLCDPVALKKLRCMLRRGECEKMH